VESANQCNLTYLLIYLLSDFDQQDTAKGPFRSSSQAATYNQCRRSWVCIFGGQNWVKVIRFGKMWLDLGKIEILHSQKHSISYGNACNYQSNHTNVEAILLSALPKDTTSKLAGLSSHYPFFMLNVKSGSCKYQLLKSFSPTRPGKRAQVYRLRGRCSNH